MVQLKVISEISKDASYSEFQFLMVQLKVTDWKFPIFLTIISIPNGSIKSKYCGETITLKQDFNS